MQFSNEVFGGKTLVRTDVQSEGFTDDPESGIQGWALYRDGRVVIRSLTVGNDNYFITEDGNASFQDVNVNGTLYVGGLTFESIINTRPKGLMFHGSRNTDSDTTSGSTELAVLTLGTEFEDQRMYRISTSTMRLDASTTGDAFAIRVRDGGSGNPTTSSDQLFSAASYIVAGGSTTASTIGGSIVVSCDDSASTSFTNYHSGTHNLLLTLARTSGTGTGSLYESSATVNPIELYVEDLGPLVANTGVAQSGSGGGTPVTPFTYTYNATWNGTYTAAGARRTDSNATGKLFQGYYSSNNGNQKSLIGFNFSQIQSDLAGATITGCEVYVYYRHWYYNAGGTAVIGYHNLSNTSVPSSYPGSGITPGGWTESWQVNQGKWVTLGIATGQGFQGGTVKGITLGPAGSGHTTDQAYYGYADAIGQAHPVQLRITGTK